MYIQYNITKRNWNCDLNCQSRNSNTQRNHKQDLQMSMKCDSYIFNCSSDVNDTQVGSDLMFTLSSSSLGLKYWHLCYWSAHFWGSVINGCVPIDWDATLHDGILTQQDVSALTPNSFSFFLSLFSQKILSEHSAPIPSQQYESANMNSLLVSSGGVAVENPRSALSPLTTSLLEQLEARIKELKAWLRDTELLIFNSCLRQDKDASEQLQSFKVGRAVCQWTCCDVGLVSFIESSMLGIGSREPEKSLVLCKRFFTRSIENCLQLR